VHGLPHWSSVESPLFSKLRPLLVVRTRVQRNQLRSFFAACASALSSTPAVADFFLKLFFMRFSLSIHRDDGPVRFCPFAQSEAFGWPSSSSSVMAGSHV